MKNTNENKLTHMTEMISANLEDLLVTGNGDYEYSTSYGGSKAKNVAGLWRVSEHTIEGTPYVTKFADSKFKDMRHTEPVYESTFEFIKNVCIKRVMIYADINADDSRNRVHYDYRMNLVFLFELHKETINVLPLLGYQYVSIDNEPGAVKELTSSTAWLPFGIKFDNDTIIIEDGKDIKKLERASL